MKAKKNLVEGLKVKKKKVLNLETIVDSQQHYKKN